MLNPLDPRRTADRSNQQETETKLALKTAAMAEVFLMSGTPKGTMTARTNGRTASGSNPWEEQTGSG